MFITELAKAKRPGIIVGGGAYRARDAIIEFAMAFEIPCFRTWSAQDIITDDLPVYAGTVGTYGGPGRNFGIQNCDLLLSLGCRMSGRITGGQPETFARGARKYIVDVDPVALNTELQQVRGDCNILSTCERFMETLNYSRVQTHTAWLAQCVEWKDKYDPVTKDMQAGDEVHHYGFMRELSELLPNNAIVVSDTGGNVIMMGHCFRSKRGQRIFSSNGNTPMGFSMCGAIGAWFAEPARPVICIIGDGGFCMNSQELQTLVNYGVNIKVFIINNKVLGNTASYQRVNGMKQVACSAPDYVPPDFTKLVAVYGLIPYSITGRAMTASIVEMMLATEAPCICDVQHDDFCQYEPRLSVWEGGIEECFPPLPKAEFLSNMIVQPVKGWEKRRESMR